MAAPAPPAPASAPAPAPRVPARGSPLLVVVVIVAVLYLAREVLIPLALAILLSFLLAPAVGRLEHWRIPRMAATILVAGLCFSLLGAVAWVAANQAVSLAAKLPQYRENISAKIRALRGTSHSKLGKAAEALKQIENEAAPAGPPLAVKETPASPLASLTAFVAPFAKPLATTLAVIIFTILMLLNRENMRERLIVLVGAGRLNITTQALEEAADRVGRYLRMQVLINAGFGVPFGAALYFIGVPNALLWGLLGAILRFVPYAGVWIAMSMPALLAFAISDQWTMVLWTVGVFLVLELLAVYLAEPVLYSRSAGLSAIAVIAAALFWTWLWGPLGLLLATPLTVCVAVMGRYIPRFAFLNVLLGVEPALPPEARFYQRLIALDQEEAGEQAEEYAEKHGLPLFLDSVLIPALALAERDRHQGAIDPGRERFIFETTREIVDDLYENQLPDLEPESAAICIVSARDDADDIAALVLARTLTTPERAVLTLPHRILASEAVGIIAGRGCGVVCISAVPPGAVPHARYLAKRLRARMPKLQIVVALWAAEGDIERAKARLAQAGVNEVVTRLPVAVERIEQLAAVANAA